MIMLEDGQLGDSSRWPGVLENKNQARDLVLGKGAVKVRRSRFGVSVSIMEPKMVMCGGGGVVPKI